VIRRDRVGLVVLVTAVVIGSPLLLRHVPFFRVRRVEVVGARYLTPRAVLGAMALAADHNVFDRVGPAAARVRAMDGIVDVSVDRRLPATLRVTVAERMPALFVRGVGGLGVVDCDGRSLPYDPTQSALDLPIADEADTTLARTACAVRSSASTLFEEVDVVRRVGADAVRLDIGWQRVLIPAMAPVGRIRAVEVVRRHIAAQGVVVGELDARYAGWVVARRVGS